MPQLNTIPKIFGELVNHHTLTKWDMFVPLIRALGQLHQTSVDNKNVGMCAILGQTHLKMATLDSQSMKVCIIAMVEVHLLVLYFAHIYWIIAKKKNT